MCIGCHWIGCIWSIGLLWAATSNVRIYWRASFFLRPLFDSVAVFSFLDSAYVGLHTDISLFSFALLAVIVAVLGQIDRWDAKMISYTRPSNAWIKTLTHSRIINACSQENSPVQNGRSHLQLQTRHQGRKTKRNICNIRKRSVEMHATHIQIFTECCLLLSISDLARHKNSPILTACRKSDVLTKHLFRRRKSFRPIRWLKQFIQRIYIQSSVHGLVLHFDGSCRPLKMIAAQKWGERVLSPFGFNVSQRSSFVCFVSLILARLFIVGSIFLSTLIGFAKRIMAIYYGPYFLQIICEIVNWLSNW